MQKTQRGTPAACKRPATCDGRRHSQKAGWAWLHAHCTPSAAPGSRSLGCARSLATAGTGLAKPAREGQKWVAHPALSNGEQRACPPWEQGIWRAGAMLVSVGRRMPYESVLSNPLVDGSPLGGRSDRACPAEQQRVDSLFQGGSNAAVSHRTRLCDAPLLEGLATYRISLGARVCTDKMPKGEKPVEFCFGERGAFGHAMRPTYGGRRGIIHSWPSSNTPSSDSRRASSGGTIGTRGCTVGNPLVFRISR